MGACAVYRGHKIAGGRAPLSMITCYDHPSARLIDAAGVDVILVGDSLGTNVLGYDSPTAVSMEDMLHHLRAVRRGVERAPVLVDMPYRSYDTVELARTNAARFVEAGADGVKLEGEHPEIVAALVADGIAVCGHIGFTPQSMDRPSVRGKEVAEAVSLLAAARALDAAGICLLVLELMPAELSACITAAVEAATIGIGAGCDCDGQVQVIHDVLGITGRRMRHALRLAELGAETHTALAAYHQAVRERRFPGPEHARHVDAAFIAAVEAVGR